MRRAVATLLLLAGACGPGEETPKGAQELTPEEVRVLAMDLLQDAVSQQMRRFVRAGSLSDDPEELENPATFVATSGVGAFGMVSLEVCEEGTVAVMGTEAAEGSVFVVKVRGLEPHRNGDALFGHYVKDVPCDASDGPEEWPGGYRISREGLMKGGDLADIPLE